MSDQPAFSFSDVSGGYGAMTIVRDISASIGPGQCLCILGRNGVGKTTLIKLLSGHLRHSSGQILLDGLEVGGMTPDARRSLGLSYAMQERPTFDNLSVRDNLMLMRSSDPIDIYERFFQAFPILQDRLAQMAGTLSGGERKILSFVRTMAEGGKVTLLDEPSEGVRPENIDRMKGFIEEAKSKGHCLVVVEQHLNLAEAIADRYLVMDQGRSAMNENAADVSRNDLLKHITV